MKKHIIALILMAGLSVSGAVNFGVEINVDVAGIKFEPMTFKAESVTTNTAWHWEEITEVVTNDYAGLQPSEVVTNTVNHQVSDVQVVTNAAQWIIPFDYTVHAGEELKVNDSMSGSPKRDAVIHMNLPIPDAQMLMLCGEELHTQLITAANLFGTVPVYGAIDEVIRQAVWQFFYGTAEEPAQ